MSTCQARVLCPPPCPAAAPARPDGRHPMIDDTEALLGLARGAGLLVTLDGQIGREKYQSVAGSLRAFQRFAAALHDALAATDAQ